jgi:adenine-specific DNA-methyltransferase
MLVCYRRGSSADVAVNALDAKEGGRVELDELGTFDIDGRDGQPWLLPRARNQSGLVARLLKMPHRLADYGWRVSTGPLVWNRHKQQLRDGIGAGCIPIVWAEAVTADGRFMWRSDRRTHKPWFAPELPRDEWLVVRQCCVLVQRTTAKEQRRRLIVAELPQDFFEKFDCATIENHLNMIRPADGTPKASAATITAVLQSAAADAAFRCINGSVAVSAAELEAMPMPEPNVMAEIDRLVAAGAARDLVERTIQQAYGLEIAGNAIAAAA